MVILYNDDPITLEHSGDEPILYCFPVGSVGCGIYDCGDGSDDSKLVANTAISEIPEVKIVDVSELNDLSLSTNLTTRSSQISVTIPSSTSETSLRLTDMSGNIVLSKSIHSNENLIPVENLRDGVFMVTIQNADYTFTKKVIIQN